MAQWHLPGLSLLPLSNKGTTRVILQSSGISSVANEGTIISVRAPDISFLAPIATWDIFHLTLGIYQPVYIQ